MTQKQTTRACLYFPVALLLVWQTIGCVSSHGDASKKNDEKAQKEMMEMWGVQVEGIRLSAQGYVLDFRYRVTDAEKSRPILDRKNKPRLIHEESGKVLQVTSGPKVGAMRQNTLKPTPNRVYFALFTNTGRFVKKGDRVAVNIGDFKAEGLVVE